VATIRVYDLAKRRALVTRESAKEIGAAIKANSTAESAEVTLDFAGVEAVTPSFVDELLAVADDTLRREGKRRIKLLFLNTPTRLSAKFEAVARAREVSISESREGVWSITSSAA